MKKLEQKGAQEAVGKMESHGRGAGVGGKCSSTGSLDKVCLVVCHQCVCFRKDSATCRGAQGTSGTFESQPSTGRR